MMPAKRHAGFTLVELIAAVTLTALVAGSTVAMVRSSAAARQLVNQQAELQQETHRAASALATALRNVCRFGPEEAVLEGVSDRAGELPADRIRFFTISRKAVRPGKPESDVRECEFFLGQPRDRAETTLPALMVRIDPTRNEPPDGGGVMQVIAENVVALELTYHDGRQWLAEWPLGAPGWPVAVRIRLLVADPANPRKTWPASRLVNFPYRPRTPSADQTGPGTGEGEKANTASPEGKSP